MTSIDSSKTSRLTRSASADISLSPEATIGAQRLGLAWHGAPPDAELHAAAGEDVGHGEVLGQAQRVPLGHHVEHLAEPDALGLRRQVQAEQDEVGDDLVALVLEVVLGEPHRVVAERRRPSCAQWVRFS